MKKRFVCVMLALAVVLSLTACGGSAKMSGKYYNINDDSDTVEFTGKKDEVILSGYGLGMSGKYTLSGDKLIITVNLLGSDMATECTLSEDKNSFTYKSLTYSKDGGPVNTDSASNDPSCQGSFSAEFIHQFLEVRNIIIYYQRTYLEPQKKSTFFGGILFNNAQIKDSAFLVGIYFFTFFCYNANRKLDRLFFVK